MGSGFIWAKFSVDIYFFWSTNRSSWTTVTRIILGWAQDFIVMTYWRANSRAVCSFITPPLLNSFWFTSGNILTAILGSLSWTKYFVFIAFEWAFNCTKLAMYISFLGYANIR